MIRTDPYGRLSARRFRQAPLDLKMEQQLGMDALNLVHIFVRLDMIDPLLFSRYHPCLPQEARPPGQSRGKTTPSLVFPWFVHKIDQSCNYQCTNQEHHERTHGEDTGCFVICLRIFG